MEDPRTSRTNPQRRDRPPEQARHARQARAQRPERARASERARRTEGPSAAPRARHSREAQRPRAQRPHHAQRPREQYARNAQRPQARRPRRASTAQRNARTRQANARSSQTLFSKLFSKRTLILLAALLIAAIIIAAFAIRCSSSQANEGGRSALSQSVNDKSTSTAQQDAGAVGLRVTKADLQEIPDESGVFTFSLTDVGIAPSLSDAHRAAIEEAYDELTQYGASAGFLLIDLDAGMGIGCNIDEPIYGASAIKGFYACYLAQGQVDAGRARWSDEFPESLASGYMDENGDYLNDDVYEYSLETLVEDSVVHSDNDAYRLLRVCFDGDDYTDWLNAAGVDGDDWRFTDWWTNYTAREAATLWLNIYDYIQGNAASAARLQQLLSSTNVSMIRSALNGAGTFGFSLISKAGWNADGEQVQFNALGDAGIVTLGEKHYLIAVLSSYPGEEDTFPVVERMIASLWNARGDLSS